jgi:hypothetical protein
LRLKVVSELDHAALKAWVDAGVKVRVHVAKPGDMVFIPTGWTGVEQTRPDQSVIYGFRKSFLQKGEASKSNYSACTVLFERAQRNTERMKTILKLMEPQPSAPSGITGPPAPASAPLAAGEEHSASTALTERSLGLEQRGGS